MKPKYHLIPIAILLVCVVIFGFTFNTSARTKAMIPWSERTLTWEDFELVDSMNEDYVASIYSHIQCPDLITDADSRVYAFMNPNLSKRLRDEHDSYNVLVHEQYHFNITEYCARLLRKEIVNSGLGGLSLEKLKTLKNKYAKKRDSLQNVYDSITDHNANSRLQRYWELQIDDWLRQTAFYRNEDINSYYNFTKERTNFFKKIYFTQTQKILTSYPVGEKEKDFGEVYEVIYPKYGGKETVVKFYKNGKLNNGGYFETAITKITERKKGVFEVHYYNPEESYNTGKTACIRSIKVDNNNNKVEQFFNADRERTYRNGVYEKRFTYNTDEKWYYTSYYDKEGRQITNQYGISHVKRILDDKDRTIVVQNLNRKNRPKNDNSHIARYETTFSEDHVGLSKRYYDEDGGFALHLSDYHLSYEYDSWGRKVKISSLNANGEKTYDHNGASIYKYTYDRHDRQTSVKRFNIDGQPIIANDDYFQQVTDYDDQGRLLFQAEYYLEYVLSFSDKKDAALKYAYENDSITKTYNVDAYNNTFENDHNVGITVQVSDSKKRIVKETYLDASENYAKTEDGAVTYEYKYDSPGNQIETAVYDSIGQPKEFEADVAIIRWDYDDKGNKTKTTYFNRNNELAFANDSITFNVYEYDQNNNLTKRTNYDKQMRPVEIDGVFKTIFHINKAGLDSLVTEYDSKNNLKKAVAITRYFYNKYGNKIRAEFYDSNYIRTLNKNGISAISYTYNSRQLLIGYTYFDEYNRPANNKKGVAFEKWKLNDMGHTLTYSYYDKEKSPVIGEYGYHKVDYEWDPIGQLTKSTTYGADLKLISDEFGTAVYGYSLTPSGMIQTIERHNSKGILADNTNNVAITHYEPRLNGLYYLEKELNAAGEIVNDSIVD